MRNKKGQFQKGHKVPKKWRDNLAEIRIGKKQSDAHIEKRIAPLRGRKRPPMTEKQKNKIREKLIGRFVGNESAQWKGNNAGYSAIHKWVVKWKGLPQFCEMCEKLGKRIKGKWNIDWANINHKYRRILEDYFGLCPKCHRQYDKWINVKEN